MPLAGTEQFAEQLAIALATRQQQGVGIDVQLLVGLAEPLLEPQPLEEGLHKGGIGAAEHGLGILEVVAQLFLRYAPVNLCRNEVVLQSEGVVEEDAEVVAHLFGDIV